MINILLVDERSEPAELLKEFRKLLMTGGAVVRLAPEIDAAGLAQLYARFAPDAVPHSLAEEVLRAVARSAALTDELREQLKQLSLPLLARDLEEREGQDCDA